MDLPYLRNAGGDGAGAGAAMERMNRSKTVLGKGHTFESCQAPHFTKLFFFARRGCSAVAINIITPKTLSMLPPHPIEPLNDSNCRTADQKVARIAHP